MYLKQQTVLKERLGAILREQYELELPTLVVEQPPESKFGEYALPLAFELARKLRKAPRKIAEEIVAKLTEEPLAGFASFEVAGAGYINARLVRAEAAQALASAAEVDPAELTVEKLHALVEHTSINPNKAAHVGHLRNAILGDTFVRLLKAAGNQVDVQNYIDNTGVQVADIVVGLKNLPQDTVPGVPIDQQNTLDGIKKLVAYLDNRAKSDPGDREALIDYYCWNLYARVSTWYSATTDLLETDESEAARRKQLRLDTLHAIEQGGNEDAEIADLIATRVLRRHLETMLRLGIEYDFLPRESEILHLHFWNLAFEQMKAKGVLRKIESGKNAGCWVMNRMNDLLLKKINTRVKGDDTHSARDFQEEDELLEGPDYFQSSSPELDEDAKVIVRSNGTVTYVGKDIAYHLWKFGLLGKDFGYKKFFEYPRHTCWISAEEGEADHPHFGDAQAIYNVIDSRQADPQANVVGALMGMGYTEQAARYTHFSYEMVALTPDCAQELGYPLKKEDEGRAYIEVSGRKGFGVKADDLIDKLVAATKGEVDSRHPELEDAERAEIAQKIAVGALRYFMLKYTRNSVIAFDFKDALSFEGETGPYLQYAVVRTRSIFRKAGMTAEQALADVAGVELGGVLDGEENEAIWAVWLRAGKTSLLLEQCIQTAEPAYLAKHAFQLAQEFSNFYRKHHILTEENAAKKTLLLATAAVAQRELVRSLKWLGIDAPEVM